jgi:hypothetical protein
VKRTRKVSRLTWSAFVASVLLCGAVWIVRHRIRPIRWTGDAELIALTTERERLHGSDDATREALRAQQRTRLQQGWTAERLAEVPEKFGAGWRCEWQSAGVAERRGVVTRIAPRLDDWPGCIAAVRQWAGTPGVLLDSLDFVANGAGRRRHFAQVALGLRFILAAAPIGDGERAAPSGGPLPVPPATEPPTTRKVGAVPSLRRPSASAEPPAPATVSAPFRSDPPGLRDDKGSPISVPQPRKSP